MVTWNVKRGQYKVSDFASWQRIEQLDLRPFFQRRAVWKPGAKSYFIDTIVRGLPVPIIIIRERRSDLSKIEPVRELVDGQQRLRTIFTYIDPSLLTDYESEKDDFTVLGTHNKELAGKSFRNLPADIQQRILDYEFSVHTLPVGVGDREVLQIFARLNATGYKLTHQELRNADWFGEFKTSMYELASEQLYRWREWKIFTEYNLSRMEEVELTSEFAQLMIRKQILGKSHASLNRLYEDKDGVYPERAEVARRFRTIMDTIDDKIGKDIKSLPFARKTLFYSLFAFLYDVKFGITSEPRRFRAKSVSPSVVEGIMKAGMYLKEKDAPADVIDAISHRTTHPSSRTAIVKYLHKMSGNA